MSKNAYVEPPAGEFFYQFLPTYAISDRLVQTLEKKEPAIKSESTFQRFFLIPIAFLNLIKLNPRLLENQNDYHYSVLVDG